jgi:hypothetical protein
MFPKLNLVTAFYIGFSFIVISLISSSAHAANVNNADFRVSSDTGYSIAVYSQLSPIEINKIHSWIIEITDRNNRPLKSANIEMIGGMPDHDHGLPTEPQVTEEVEPGKYLLEGVRFHMQGKWQIIFTIKENGNKDQAILELQL